MNKYKLIFLVFLFFNSCSSNLQTNKKELSVILYKQTTIANDADLNFDKIAFWEDNIKNHTFITQNFDEFQFNDIISKVEKLKFVDNSNPNYFPYIDYAFVVYEKNKIDNDTIYYNGYDNWWILRKGNYSMYKDENNKLSDNLKMFYPIFRNCSFKPSK